MPTRTVAAAMQRVMAILGRRPEMGLQDDAPASALWEGGTRVETRHANGTRVQTDMPTEFGGTGDQVSPGWLLRAGLASCAATRIVMAAAQEGIALTTLEVVASSRSDTRGLLGMRDERGALVPAEPGEVTLRVRIAAPGVPPQRLRGLVEGAQRMSPVTAALHHAVPIALHTDIEGS